MTGQWLSTGTPVSSTNKTDCHDITEILLKVALNTITLTFIFIGINFVDLRKMRYWLTFHRIPNCYSYLCLLQCAEFCGLMLLTKITEINIQ